MLRPIKLNGKPCLGTIKIQNIAANRYLSMKPARILLQKFIPQLSFLFCHILSQLLG